MALKIITFGRLTELAAKEFIIQAGDTTELRAAIEKLYPSISGISYAIAINKKITSGTTQISEGDEIALLPPYSGG